MTPIPGEIPYVFAGAGLERLAMRRKDKEWLAAALAAADSCFVPVPGGNTFVTQADRDPRALLMDAAEARPLLAAAEFTVFLGEFG